MRLVILRSQKKNDRPAYSAARSTTNGKHRRQIEEVEAQASKATCPAASTGEAASKSRKVEMQRKLAASAPKGSMKMEFGDDDEKEKADNRAADSTDEAPKFASVASG